MSHVCFDFDGVIHSYTSPWTGDDIVLDPPTPGIKAVIDRLRADGYQVVVLTSRCLSPGGREAVDAWLHEHNVTVDDITSEKIPARCYVDDRAVRFDGDPTGLYETITHFEPWGRRRGKSGDLATEPSAGTGAEAKPALRGAIIGDIVGSIYEFDNIKTKDFPLFGPGCAFTDDTVMTVAVADAFSKAEADASDEQLVRLIKNSLRYWGNKYPDMSYGGRFRDWLYSDDPQPYNSSGNGAPMRCSAAGWVATSPEDARHLGELTAMPTHNHPEALKAAALTAELIYLARTGSTMKHLRRIAELYYVIPKVDELRPTYDFSESSQDTMPAALAAFFDSTGFEDAIRNAISLGGDSDTIAAITGSIAEAYYGVPEFLWVKTIMYLDNSVVDALAHFNRIFTV